MNSPAHRLPEPDSPAQATHEALCPADVQWFASSRRLVAGRPDTRYGWWEAPDAEGPAVVKALDAGLSAASSSLLHHETQMLHQLCKLGAPVPEPLVAAMQRYPSCVITRFGGLSLRTLLARQQRGLPGLNLRERLSVWGHLARRLHPLASRHNVLVADLWAGNVLVPLTNVRSGQLRLSQALLVDHAHTLVPGSGLQRPLWIDETQKRIAPELGQALRADREALEGHFAEQGLALPGTSRLPGDLECRSREAWRTYRAPSALQSLLDANRLNASAAMQFAIGQALAEELHRTPQAGAEDPDLDMHVFKSICQRLTAAEPTQRLPSLDALADALGEALGGLGQASAATLAPIQPDELLLEPVTSAPPATDDVHAPKAAAQSVTLGPLPWPWLLLAAATGTLLAGMAG